MKHQDGSTFFKGLFLGLLAVIFIAVTFAALDIPTNIDNSVQTIKTIVVTSNGQSNGTPIMVLNSGSSTPALQVSGAITIGKSFGNDDGTLNKIVGLFSSILGGFANIINGDQSSIIGGNNNTAKGAASTVLGGRYNVASGNLTTAAGINAQAIHNYTWVWSDWDPNLYDPANPDPYKNTFSSTNSNQFLIRAKNGVGINTNSPSYALDVNGNGRFAGDLSLDPGRFVQFGNGGPAGSYGGFNWNLTNDSASMYAREVTADQTDYVFKMSDNSAGDRFVWWIDEWQGPAYDVYPMVLAGNYGNFYNGTMYIDSNNKRVGVNTTSPSYNLQVQKTSTAPALMIGGAYAGGPRLQTYGLDADGAAWMGLGTDMAGGSYEHSLYFPALGFQTIGSYNGTTYSEKMRITKDGNVGIGINAPATKLDVNGTTRLRGDAEMDANNTLYFGREESFGGSDFGGADFGFIRWDNDNNSYNYWGDSSENGALVIGSMNDGNNGVSDSVVLKPSASTIVDSQLLVNGNVGIGTTSPVAKLDITTSDPNSIPLMKLGGATVSNIGNALIYRNLAELRFEDNNNWDWNKWGGIAYRSNENKLIIGGSSSSYFNRNGAGVAPNVLFDGVNNVGIGTTNPTQKLHVIGTVTAGDTSSTGVPNRVGISNSMAFEARSATTDPAIAYHKEGVYTMYLQGQNSPRGLRVLSPTSETAAGLFVDGSVGVGTTNPSQKLHVNGHVYFGDGVGGDGIQFEQQGTFHRIAFNELRFYDWDYGEMLTLNNGNVGIGTTSPAEKLDVNGNVKSSGLRARGNNVVASASNSVAAGDQAQAWGDGSVSMGTQTKSSGTSSVSLGYRAWANGKYSTAIGNFTTANGESSMAMGDHTTADGSNSVTMGTATKTSAKDSVAMGYQTQANGMASIAVGYASVANANDSVAMGDHTVANSAATMAIGTYNIGYSDSLFEVGMGSAGNLKNGLTVKKDGSVILDKLNVTTSISTPTLFVDKIVNRTYQNITLSGAFLPDANSPMAIRTIGNNTNRWGDLYTNGLVVKGVSANVNSSYGVSIGTYTTAAGDYSVALGYGAYSAGPYSVALGNSYINGGYYNTTMGSSTIDSANNSTAMGGAYVGYGDSNTAMGSSSAYGYGSTAMGSSYADGDSNTAMGSSSAYAPYATAMGSSSASASFSTAMGSSSAGASYSTSMGQQTQAYADSTTVIGKYNVGLSNSLFEIGMGTTWSSRVNAMTVLNNGNVGIGTTNPSTKLESVGSAATTFEAAGFYNTYAYGNSDKAEARINIGKIEYNNRQPMGSIGAFPTNNGDSSNGNMVFYTRNAQAMGERMRIDKDGNVGIGITSPAAKLHVNGNTYLDADWTNDTAFRIREGASDSYGAFFKYGLGDVLAIGTRNGSTSDITAMQITRGSSNVKFNGQICNQAGGCYTPGYGAYSDYAGNADYAYSSDYAYNADYAYSSDYASYANNLLANRTNWNNYGTISAVVGQLAWKNYGNNHTIFDASAGTSPSGTSVDKTNSQYAWTASYPTLMGWNGANTYGVRVDSARKADTADNATNLGGKPATYYANYDSNTLGNNVDFNTITYALDRAINIEPIHAPNYSNQQNTPFYSYGQLVTFGGQSMFPFQLAVENGSSQIKFRSAYKYSDFNFAGTSWTTLLDSTSSTQTKAGSLSIGGNVTAGGFYYASDISLKKDIISLDNALEKINKLNGYSFSWKSTDKKDIGVIAQEVEKVFPELVHTDDKGIKSVEYANLVAPIIEAVKSLTHKIDDLFVKYLDQEARINALEKRLQKLESIK